MTELNPSLQWSTAQQAVAATAATGFSERQLRPLEYFGATAVDFDETPVDNLAAITAAIEWCSNTGGAVGVGGGVYGIDGEAEMTPFTTFWGYGKWNSVVEQLSETADIDTFTSPSVEDGGTAYCHLRNFQVRGGWTTNWSHTAQLGAGIRLRTPAGGPSHALLAARTGASYSDPHNTIEGMLITQCAGAGLITEGRGENQIHQNEISKCLGNGIEAYAPDDWWDNNTVYTCGNNGMLINAGNQRIANHKHWFIGMMTGAEGIGAGYYIDGSGISGVSIANCHSQDTWGPGLIVSGDSLLWLGGSIDEAGGGRLEQQGFGWQGARSKQRSNIRVSGSTGSKVEVNVSGGDRVGESNRPHLVDFDSSGAANNYIETWADENAVFDTELVRTVAGFNNSKRWSAVRKNGQLVFGKVSLAQLQDSTHGVNAPDGPSTVYLNGTEDGQYATRNDDDTWAVHTPNSTVTPV